ncbi:MAG: hypothetical protein ACREQ5_01500 [Candidatus Dormibacteria bacterium]
MSLTLITATEVAGLVVAVGGAGVVIRNGVRDMRRFWRFVDRQEATPGALDKLTKEVKALTDAVKEQGMILMAHVDGEAPKWLADGQAWGKRLEAADSALAMRIATLERVNSQVQPPAG